MVHFYQQECVMLYLRKARSKLVSIVHYIHAQAREKWKKHDFTFSDGILLAEKKA